MSDDWSVARAILPEMSEAELAYFMLPGNTADRDQGEEQEKRWAESERRHAAARQAELALDWATHYRRVAHSLRAQAEKVEQKADKVRRLSEGGQA